MFLLFLLFLRFYTGALGSSVTSAISNVRMSLDTNVIQTAAEVSLIFQTTRTLDREDYIELSLPKFSRNSDVAVSSNSLVVSPSSIFEVEWVSNAV